MPATISTLGQLISLIYLVFDYLGWGPTELGAQGGRPACPPPGPALPVSLRAKPMSVSGAAQKGPWLGGGGARSELVVTSTRGPA